MKRIIESRVLAWGAMALILVMLVVTFKMRTVWWAYIDIFFGFMMVFTHLMSVYIGKKLPGVGKQLDMVSFVMGICMIVSFILEWGVLGG
ncbi:MAG: hypothetical protein NC201_07395 [Prevotella sp.]|nr:hypothetical protein [Bacteroides sp.]MCM1367052.1 hypothetical protein [Prevotella sp.]